MTNIYTLQELANWRVELRVVNLLFSGQIKANSKQDPEYDKPAITATFQSISQKGIYFPSDKRVDILRTIQKQWNKGNI